MSTVQLPVSNIFDSQMQIHTGTEKYDIRLAKEFKYHLKNNHRQNGVIGQGKYNKRFMERKWTDIKYHVQDNAAFEIK